MHNMNFILEWTTTFILNCLLRCLVFTKIFIWYLACECNTTGTVQGLNNCEKRTGACDSIPGCKAQYRGKDCGLCNDVNRYYGVFPECQRKLLLHTYAYVSFVYTIIGYFRAVTLTDTLVNVQTTRGSVFQKLKC